MERQVLEGTSWKCLLHTLQINVMNYIINKNISDRTVCSAFVTVDKSSAANVSFVKIGSVTSYCI
jgi:hypothetical protein